MNEVKPGDIVVEVLKYIKKGEVLDLGCGTGENDVFLAQNGSKQFIHKARNLAEIYDLRTKISFKEADIVEYDIERKYDLILSDFVFHFLEKDEIERIIDNIKENTKKNGINAITVLTESNPNKGFIHLFVLGELRKHYSDWHVLYYNEDKGFASMIAKKK